MNIDKLKQLLELAEMLECKAQQVSGKKVIVRSRDAGVLHGTLVSIDGANVTLSNARQLWRWHAAEGITLVDVATHGVMASKCKFSPSVADVVVLNACAVIDCAEKASKSIEAV